MTLEDIKRIISENKSFLKEKYKVTSIAIFGSYTTGSQTKGSDIDIMVDIDNSVGIEFIELADTLEKVLHAKVDLVSRKAVKPRLMNIIKNDLVYV